jgi:hypothetical protein
MDLRQYFAEQLDQEMIASRKAIARVPEGRNDWRPHPKSMTLGYLAALVAGMPGWLAMMIDYDEIDLDGNGRKFQTKAVETRAELVSLLEAGGAESFRALKGTTEEHLLQKWGLRFGGRLVSEGPRYRMMSDGALSHMAHHRGQLTVYLRLNETMVPALYGPSADETH